VKSVVHKAKPEILAEAAELVAGEMQAVEAVLQEEMRSRYADVDGLVRYGCLLGGKRLRPLLLLLSAKAVGDADEDHITLAAVIEMIHTATLVHDDVLDAADRRRHLETVHRKWGRQSSILLGDFLFSHAFYLASTLGSTFACRQIGRSTNRVCEGEMRQVQTCGDFSLREADYLDLIDAKTAELISCACHLGAHYAGASDAAAAALARYGTHLGTAFQIADDLLDITGDEEQTGKSLGTDMEQAKPTLPIIYALEQLGKQERAALVELLSRGGDEARIELRRRLDGLGVIGQAEARAISFADQAAADLLALPHSPARDLLRQLAQFSVQRSS